MTVVNINGRDIEVAFVREAIERAVWTYMYHENRLPRAHQELAHLKAIMSRCFIEINLDEIDCDKYDEEENPPKNAAEYISMLWADALNSINDHERLLSNARITMAGAENMLKRCNYPEINFEQILNEQREKVNK
jgi:hypothetical protein